MNKSLYQKCSYYHKQQIKNNFWKSGQKSFKLKENVVPDVYKKHASHIFVTSIKLFSTPVWMKKLNKSAQF